MNASEHEPVAEPEMLAVLAGSSWKSLPVPLKSFDCLAWIPHWYCPPLHPGTALKVTVVVADGARDRLRKSAELDVTRAAPGAPVIAKPAGAEIWAEPSIWVVASLVILNAKEVFAPAVGLDGDTLTAKHLPDAMQVLLVEVDAAAGVASVAAARMPAPSTPRDTRAIVKPAFRTAAPLHLQ
jgi:hypothetical protein